MCSVSSVHCSGVCSHELRVCTHSRTVTQMLPCTLYKHCAMLNVNTHVFIGDVCLADMLLDAVPTSQLLEWAETNRGCFVLCR